jgi:hypothetical protein
MVAGPGYTDADGAWVHGEDDLAAPNGRFSDLLNKGLQSIKTVARNVAIATLASDPAPAEAAAEAVATEITNRSLIEGGDPRLLTPVDGQEETIGASVGGKFGEPTFMTASDDGGVHEIGEYYLRRDLKLPLVDGAGIGFGTNDGFATALEIDPDTLDLSNAAVDLSIPKFVTPDARVATHAHTRVLVQTRAGLCPLSPSRTSMFWLGDSFVAGLDVAEEDRFYNNMGRPDIAMTIQGKGGSTGHMVALMGGAFAARFTLAGGEFPASGPVVATLLDPLVYRGDVAFTAQVGALTIAGVEYPAILERPAAFGAPFTITPVTPGPVVPAAGVVTWRAAIWETTAADLLGLVLGRNDQITTPTSIDNSIEAIGAIIASRTPVFGRAFIMAPAIDARAVPGSPAFDMPWELGKEIRRTWPRDSWSLAEWLIYEAMDVVEDVVWTADDLQARKDGMTPPSLMKSVADPTHMAGKTQRALGPRITAELVALDHIDPA